MSSVRSDQKKESLMCFVEIGKTLRRKRNNKLKRNRKKQRKKAMFWEVRARKLQCT